MSKERIDVLLVERGFCDSRARAQARILAGDVIVNDKRVDKAGEKVPRDSVIRLRGDEMPWVSRGGLKLAAALDWFAIDVNGKICVDVGASTGGFTDVLLSKGAARVYAIDVGYGQLAQKLRVDPRVVNMERTHILKMTEELNADIGVVDVSFISLEKVLPALARQLRAGARAVVLIKPQFEVGKENVGKGGIVREESLRKEAVERVLGVAVSVGFVVDGVRESAITGTDGNVEYVAALTLS